jgi:hypothetical protein
MSKYISQTTPLLSVLLMTLLFSSNASAVGKVYLDRAQIKAQEVNIKMNMFGTGGTVTLKGCPENDCPTGLTIDKKTEFTLNGTKLKRKDARDYSGHSGFVRYMKASKSAFLINWE